MNERRINPETGEEWEFVNGQWLPVSQAADVSAGEAIAIGAGRRMMDVVRGAQNLAYGAGNLLSPGTPFAAEQEQLADTVAEERRLMAPLEARRGTELFIGGMLPDLATGPLSGGLRAQMMIGAGLGSLGYQENPAMQLGLGAIGGAGGSAVGYLGGQMTARAVGRIAQTARAIGAPRQVTATGRVDLPGQQIAGRMTADAAPDMAARQGAMRELVDDAGELVADQAGSQSAARRALVEQGERLGWRFTPAQRSGSRAHEIVEESAKSNPLTAGPFVRNDETNLQLLQGQLGRAIGLDNVEALDAGTLATAEMRLGQEFSDVASELGPVNATRVSRVADDIVEQGKRGIGSQNEALAIAQRIQGHLENSKTVSPEDMMLWRSEANSAYRQATNPMSQRSDTVAAERLEGLLDAIDDSVEGAAGQRLANRYRVAREQYRTLRMLTRGKAVNDDGSLNVRTLATNARRFYRREYQMGRDGELQPATRDALRLTKVASIVAPRIGDSGTASRMFAQNVYDHPVRSMMLAATQRPLGAAYFSMSGELGGAGGALSQMVGQPAYAGSVGAAIGRGLAAAGQ